MKLKKIIEIANKVYPDGMVSTYFDEPDEDHGDTLALFIVRELSGTYNAKAPESDQLKEAVRSMDSAIRELTAVREALQHGKLLI